MLNITCIAPGGKDTFMQFNRKEGGPLDPIGTMVSAVLNCIAGQWWYIPPTATTPAPSSPPAAPLGRVITEVNCVNSA